MQRGGQQYLSTNEFEINKQADAGNPYGGMLRYQHIFKHYKSSRYTICVLCVLVSHVEGEFMSQLAKLEVTGFKEKQEL